MDKFTELAKDLMSTNYSTPNGLGQMIKVRFEVWSKDTKIITPSKERELLHLERKEVLDKKNNIQTQLDAYKVAKVFNDNEWFVNANHALRKSKQRLSEIQQELTDIKSKQKEFNALHSNTEDKKFIDNIREYVIKKYGKKRWDKIVYKCKTHK